MIELYIIGAIGLTILGIIGLLTKSKVSFDIGILGVTVDNTSRIKHYIEETQKLANLHTTEKLKYQCNILRNQMRFAESTLREICGTINAEPILYDLAHSKTKGKMKENGFEHLDPAGFSQYIGSCIDQYRELFKMHSEDTYLNSPDFSDKIASIFNHALACTNFWNAEINKLDISFEEAISKLIKE